MAARILRTIPVCSSVFICCGLPKKCIVSTAARRAALELGATETYIASFLMLLLFGVC